jgi:hypothetical protein
MKFHNPRCFPKEKLVILTLLYSSLVLKLDTA